MINKGGEDADKMHNIHHISITDRESDGDVKRRGKTHLFHYEKEHGTLTRIYI